MDRVLLGSRYLKMLVSIIIPTYNRFELLKRAIASVEAQSYTNYELIIIDDASTDETRDYLFTLEHTSLILPSNQGVSHARNRGVGMANGEYIAFLDSDDTWAEDKLAQQVAFHQEHPEVQFSFGTEKWFRFESEVKRPKKYEAPSMVNFENLLEYTFIGPSSVMIQTALLNEAGGFDESLAVCEDFDLWLRISKQTPLHLASSVVINKHAGDFEQLSSSVLSLEPYRVESLLKHKDDDLVVDVILRKLGIIEKGALKHDNRELLEFCELQRNKL